MSPTKTSEEMSFSRSNQQDNCARVGLSIRSSPRRLVKRPGSMTEDLSRRPSMSALYRGDH